MGEVFDKVGKRLGLPYPQGPVVDRLAEDGDPKAFELPVAHCRDGSLDFSYSGLKTRTLVAIEALEAEGLETPLSEETAGARVRDLLASFRAAAVAQLVDRLDRLYEERVFSSLAISGGVAANRLLRRRLPSWADERGVELELVSLAYSGDNAAMIAHAALRRQRLGVSDDPLAVEAASRLAIG